MIVNDMSDVNIDSQLTGNTLSRVDEKLIEMSNGCICCTLREDLLNEVGKLAKEGRFDYLLIESAGISEPMPVAETFTFLDEDGKSLSDVARLDTMVTVVDGEKFLEDYDSTDDLRNRRAALSEEDERNLADLLIDQIEFANILIVNKIDRMTTEDVGRLRSILAAFNPDATILESERGRVPLRSILNTGSFDMVKASASAGWLKSLSGYTPETDEYGIGNFVYRRRRPFHPARFEQFLQQTQPGVLRAKGFVWLASRNDIIGLYSLAGNVVGIEPVRFWYAAMDREQWEGDAETRESVERLWQEPYGDRMQELVFIGAGMNQDATCEALDRCLLTDEEMDLKPVGWLAFEDQFEAWEETA